MKHKLEINFDLTLTCSKVVKGVCSSSTLHPDHLYSHYVTWAGR